MIHISKRCENSKYVPLTQGIVRVSLVYIFIYLLICEFVKILGLFYCQCYTHDNQKTLLQNPKL